MKKQSIVILGIILAGSLSGIAYATSVTDTTSIFQNISVLGTCTGCGASEGSFSSYSSILNQTVSGSHGSTTLGLQINNNGTVIGLDTQQVSVVTKTGSVITNTAVTNNFESDQRLTSQSSTGIYMITLGTDNNLRIYKSDALLKTYSLTSTNFSAMNTVSVIISPSGKYIAIYGEDTGASLQRLVILQGS